MREGVLTLRALASAWLDGRTRRGELKGRSPKIERARLNALIQRHGDDPPSVLGRRQLLDVQAEFGHLAPATRRHNICTIGGFLRWLQIEGHVDTDLTVHLVKVKEPRRTPRALPASDVATLIIACPSMRSRAMVVLMVEMGLRCVEVSRLNLDFYDRTSRTLLVVGKGGHERMLPVTETAAIALDAYIEERGYQPGPLFLAVGSRPGPARRLSAKWISKRTAWLMGEIGVHRPGDGRTAHALRHTAASDVLDRCHDLRVVQQMLGHESLQSTEIYLRRADLGRLREAMEGRSYSAASTVGPPPVGSDRLRGAPSAGAVSPTAGSPTGLADRQTA